MAASGVVLAHQLAYLVARPDPHERAESLARSGHGDWSLLVGLALGLLVAALAAHAWRGAAAGARPRTPPTALRLAALQVPAFDALEAAERLLTGADPAVLLDDPAVALGVLAQVLVAAAGARLVRAAGRVGAAWARRARPRPRRTIDTRPRPAEALLAPACEAAADAGGLRGPPLTPA